MQSAMSAQDQKEATCPAKYDCDPTSNFETVTMREKVAAQDIIPKLNRCDSRTAEVAQ